MTDQNNKAQHTPTRYNGWELAEQSDGPLVQYADYCTLEVKLMAAVIERTALHSQITQMRGALENALKALENGWPIKAQTHLMAALTTEGAALQATGEI